MGRKLEVELTSDNGEMWTWRAAGAKQPKGELASSILYDGAKIGDVVKVDADFSVDGIHVMQVQPPKAKKERTDLLEMKTRAWSKDELVTSNMSKGGKKRGKGGGRNRGGGDKRGPKAEQKPRAPRLKPKGTHLAGAMSEMPGEYRPILERLAKDGIPGVRKSIKEQNAKAVASNSPKLDEAAVLDIAEKALPKIRTADWLDRAEAAQKIWDKVDLRDLRSVVVTGADLARGEEAKALQTELASKLEERIESDHAAWVKDLETAIRSERLVAALKTSSRPVKAGSPLAPEMASQLADLATAGLTSEATSHRWIVVLDSLAFSPVRAAVKPTSKPAEVSDELIGEVRRLSDRLPEIAALFGIDPASVSTSEKKKRGFLAQQRDTRRKNTRQSKNDDAKGADSKSDKKQSEDKKPKSERPRPGSAEERALAEKAEADKAEADNPEQSKDATADSANDSAEEAPSEDASSTEAPVEANTADTSADAEPEEAAEAEAPAETKDEAESSEEATETKQGAAEAKAPGEDDTTEPEG